MTTKVHQKSLGLPGHASLWWFLSDCTEASPAFSDYTQQETHFDVENQQKRPVCVCGSHS